MSVEQRLNLFEALSRDAAWARRQAGGNATFEPLAAESELFEREAWMRCLLKARRRRTNHQRSVRLMS